MNLNEIRHLLATENIQLTKSLGQNFLHDANQLRRIIAAGELSSEDRVLEIGPGLGALTQLLLESGAQVLAIEKDRRLFDLLVARWGREPRLTLLHADALDYLQREKADWSAWKVVSNLPYSVGSPILVELAKSIGAPLRMVVTLQAEVADRLAAAAGGKEYGVLSLLVQVRYDVQGEFRISGHRFFPRPDVDSACVTLVRRTTLLLGSSQYSAFARIVKRGFSQRRKMMMKLLKSEWPMEKLEAAFSELNLARTARAETVSLEQFVELTKRLTLGDNRP
jgi:16S rRNA (adenine1518-N6/adenine1519-N6)-dimethyltransferase